MTNCESKEIDTNALKTKERMNLLNKENEKDSIMEFQRVVCIEGGEQRGLEPEAAS